MKNSRVWPVKLLVACVSLTLGGIAMASDIYFTNAWTVGQRYRIMRYADGLPSPTSSVINESNDGGAANVAWPSAFQLGSNERVYASRYSSNQWRDVGVWESANGVAFTLKGIALSADATEPYGIGPAQAFFAPNEVRPFKMVYLIRNAAGAGTQLALASSVTGDPGTWQRDGVIYTASQPFETFGISPSFVTQVDNGLWAITYQAYRYLGNATLGAGPAAIITSSSPNGPFGSPKIIMEPNGEQPGIVSATRMHNFGVTNGTVRPGNPYVLRNPSGGLEAVNVVKQIGNVVYFDRPLLADYANGMMSHVAAFKIDPSLIYKDGDKWRGVFTGYGHFTDYMTEYTFRVEADTFDGPYVPSSAPIPFTPWTAEGLFSTENPTPLVVIPY